MTDAQDQPAPAPEITPRHLLWAQIDTARQHARAAFNEAQAASVAIEAQAVAVQLFCDLQDAHAKLTQEHVALLQFSERLQQQLAAQAPSPAKETDA